CTGLRRQTLPASGSPALEDRAPPTGRHPRTKAVAALPPTHVWLVGPLQGRCKEGEKHAAEAAPGHQYRRASSTELSTAWARRLAAEDPSSPRRSTSVERRGCLGKTLQIKRLD